MIVVGNCRFNDSFDTRTKVLLFSSICVNIVLFLSIGLDIALFSTHKRVMRSNDVREECLECHMMSNDVREECYIIVMMGRCVKQNLLVAMKTHSFQTSRNCV